MRAIVRVLVAAVTLTSAVHGIAWACSCDIDDRSTDELVAAYDLVAWVEVSSIQLASPPSGGCGRAPASSPVERFDVTLEVVEGFVGTEAGDVVQVQTPTDSAVCGVPFEVGQRWVVYTTPGGQVSECGPQRIVEDEADPLLEELRTLTP